LFDSAYTFGASTTAHGGFTPTRYADSAGRVTFTGTSLQLAANGADARFTLHTGACLKWSSVTGGCGLGGSCVSTPTCQARTGAAIAPDASGYVNYIILLRAKLLAGPGYGVYFRANYLNQSNPDTINFGGLTGYQWAYDYYAGYFSPCSLATAIPGSDLLGLLFTRRIDNGSEVCGRSCGVYRTRAAGVVEYPFFCPENRSTAIPLPGYNWANADWVTQWRTMLIFVNQGRAEIYLGREEITGMGSEVAPTLAGVVDLLTVGTPITSGDIGVRIWGSSVMEIDRIALYPLDPLHTINAYPW
jgi:hypothetical protein